MRLLTTDGQGDGEVPYTGKLDELQRLVGGYIEFLTFPDGSAMICNEEGKLNRMPLNRTATALALVKFASHGLDWDDVLVGPCIFVNKTEMVRMEEEEP
jgi:hypothetical protein